MPLLSVIITTSPDRESNLHFCLEMLDRQTFRQFEIIIIDDGSQQGFEVAGKATGNLTYCWRPHDGCISRSRNIGAQMAKDAKLVFLDSDVLLNPNALATYMLCFKQEPQAIFYGYCGIDWRLEAPSIWFPQRRINWFDGRFLFACANSCLPLEEQQTIPKDVPLMVLQKALAHPHLYASSGNFAICKQDYEAIGGFDESFLGWGCEDMAFGVHALKNGYRIHFVLDSWGEHQVHGRQTLFHRRLFFRQNHALFQKIRDHQLPPLNDTPRIFATEKAMVTLENWIRSHYMGR